MILSRANTLPRERLSVLGATLRDREATLAHTGVRCRIPAAPAVVIAHAVPGDGASGTNLPDIDVAEALGAKILAWGVPF